MSIEGKASYDRIYATINPVISSIFCKASECLINGEYSIALRLYQDIIEKEPNNLKALQGIADVLNHMGNHEEALIWYNKVLDYDPYNAEIWYNKGIILQKTGSHEEGLSSIRKGISLVMDASSPRDRK